MLILLASLAVTPLRKLTGWNELIKLRRMLGLFAFFYAALHFATYMVLDLFFDFSAIGKDILKRPYITVGFSALVLMIPLALTSNAAMIRRLGKRWQQLHYLVYGIAMLGVVHFYWLVKADIRRPVQYGAVLALLLGYRSGRQVGITIEVAKRSKRSSRSKRYAASSAQLHAIRSVGTFESLNVWNRNEFHACRLMPSLSMRERNVLGLMPSSSAAPFLPWITQLVSARARRI